MKKLLSITIIGILFICTICVSSNPYYHQPNLEWELKLGGFDYDTCYSVQETDDGDFIFAGGSYSFGPGQSDVWIIKTDDKGNIIWNNTYGGPRNESCYCIQETSDGCFVVTGKTKVVEPDDFNALLMKIDADGNQLWEKTYGDDGFDASWWVEPTLDDGFILVGITESKGVGAGDIWVIKTDSNGEIIWDKTYGGSENEEAEEVLVLEDGNFIIVGSTNSFNSVGKDLIILCIDNEGSLQWQKVYGGYNDDEAWSIEQIDDNSYFILGRTYSFGSGGQDFWLLKIDDSGEILFNRTFGDKGLDQARRIQKTLDDKYLLSGCTESIDTGVIDYWLIVINEQGTVLWNTIIGSQDFDICYETKQSTDLGYILTGSTYNLINHGNLLIMKLSSFENQLPVKPEKPDGDTKIRPEKEYEFSTVSSDPDGDQLYYQWDWGDGSTSDWIGPCNSNEPCEKLHTWIEKGEYEIKVRVKDEHGGESEWSDPLIVSLPRYRFFDIHFLIQWMIRTFTIR